MRRRGFLAVLGGAAGWALAGHAEQPERMRRISVLTALPEDISGTMVGSLARSLESLGWVEGKDIRIDHRFAAGDPTLLETSAAELVGRRRKQFLQYLRRRSLRCGGKPAQYRSFS